MWLENLRVVRAPFLVVAMVALAGLQSEVSKER